MPWEEGLVINWLRGILMFQWLTQPYLCWLKCLPEDRMLGRQCEEDSFHLKASASTLLSPCFQSFTLVKDHLQTRPSLNWLMIGFEFPGTEQMKRQRVLGQGCWATRWSWIGFLRWLRSRRLWSKLWFVLTMSSGKLGGDHVARSVGMWPSVTKSLLWVLEISWPSGRQRPAQGTGLRCPARQCSWVFSAITLAGRGFLRLQLLRTVRPSSPLRGHGHCLSVDHQELVLCANAQSPGRLAPRLLSFFNSCAASQNGE